MEKWEIDLRKKLESELEDGYYQFGGEIDGTICFGTGKGGAINYHVALQKAVRDLTNESHDTIKESKYDNGNDKTVVTEDDFLEAIMKLLRNLNQK